MSLPLALALACALSSDGFSSEARRPQAPKPDSGVTIYGVVYDLATKAPVAGAKVLFGPLGDRAATTDADGWYKISFPKNAEISPVNALAPGYRGGALQDRKPPLASLSAARRRGVAEESESRLPPIDLDLPNDERLAELELAMVPLVWPSGAPPAQRTVAFDPPYPQTPPDQLCRFYGVVYDLATRLPVQNAEISSAGNRAKTDIRGRYELDIRRDRLDHDMTVTASIRGYRPGVLADDPGSPLRKLGIDERRQTAEALGPVLDPAPLPAGDGCEDGIIRYDLAAVPETWPPEIDLGAAASVRPEIAGAALSARTDFSPLAFVSDVSAFVTDSTRGFPLTDDLDPVNPDDPKQAARALMAREHEHEIMLQIREALADAAKKRRTSNLRTYRDCGKPETFESPDAYERACLAKPETSCVSTNRYDPSCTTKPH